MVDQMTDATAEPEIAEADIAEPNAVEEIIVEPPAAAPPESPNGNLICAWRRPPLGPVRDWTLGARGGFFNAVVGLSYPAADIPQMVAVDRERVAQRFREVRAEWERTSPAWAELTKLRGAADEVRQHIDTEDDAVTGLDKELSADIGREPSELLFNRRLRLDQRRREMRHLRNWLKNTIQPAIEKVAAVAHEELNELLSRTIAEHSADFQERQREHQNRVAELVRDELIAAHVLVESSRNLHMVFNEFVAL
jgi:hypothetical protein